MEAIPTSPDQTRSIVHWKNKVTFDLKFNVAFLLTPLEGDHVGPTELSGHNRFLA